MSGKLVGEVLAYSQQQGRRRLILVAIAEECRGESRTCWQAVDRIAAKARCSGRTVQRLLPRIAADEELVIQYGHGRGNTHHFEIKDLVELTGRRAREVRENGSDKTRQLDAFYQTGKGDKSPQKVTTLKGDKSNRNGDNTGGKGDTAMSPEPYNRIPGSLRGAAQTAAPLARAAGRGLGTNSGPEEPGSTKREKKWAGVPWTETHVRLELALIEEQDGAIPDLAAQRDAIHWLLDEAQESPEICVACLKHQFDEYAAGLRHGRVSWLSVKNGLGTYKAGLRRRQMHSVPNQNENGAASNDQTSSKGARGGTTRRSQFESRGEAAARNVTEALGRVGLSPDGKRGVEPDAAAAGDRGRGHADGSHVVSIRKAKR
jgi:hypothetical protein